MKTSTTNNKRRSFTLAGVATAMALLFPAGAVLAQAPAKPVTKPVTKPAVNKPRAKPAAKKVEPPPAKRPAGERAKLVDHMGDEFLGLDVHLPTAKAHQVREAHMRPQVDATGLGQTHRVVHDQRVAGMETAGHIGR